MVNGHDEIGPQLSPDYLTSVRDGGFYGWPWSYWGKHEDPRARPPNPDMVARALTPDYAGIRPKLHGPGEPQPDFQLHGAANHGIEGLMALFGIESPGLTSSLAIGEAVAQSLTARV